MNDTIKALKGTIKKMAKQILGLKATAIAHQRDRAVLREVSEEKERYKKLLEQHGIDWKSEWTK